MENNLQIFNFEEREVRTVVIENDTWFVLTDICKALGLTNPTVVMQRLEEDEVTKLDLGGLSGISNLVNESGLYAVILRSDKPQAKVFRKWVTSEVLPAIRKNGEYKMRDELVLEYSGQLQALENKLENLIDNMPLYAIDCLELQEKLKAKVVEQLGGKKANAYKNKSIRTQAFADIQSQLRREFNVKSYKAIKRSQLTYAEQMIENYKLPLFIQVDVKTENKTNEA